MRAGELLQDLRYGVRMLLRSPGFAAVAIGTTGLAIGVNCAFFTLVDSLVWRPIPVAAPERFVKLAAVTATRENSLHFSYPQYQDIAARARSLRNLTAFAPGRVALVDPSGGRRATAVGAGFVSANYFAALGGVASRGRTLLPSDGDAGAPPVIAISHSLWERAFASANDVVGRTVLINGVSATISGVIRADFIGVNPVVPDIWLPLAASAFQSGAGRDALHSRTNRFLMLHGHLREGITREHASAEISPIIAEAPPPAGSAGAASQITGARVLPQHSLVPLDSQTALMALPGFLAVALVLVIACANVAILLLARALARQREIAVRMALGASRARLVRQLLAESLLIATAAAALGLLIADWTVTATSRAIVDQLPISIGSVVLDLSPSARVYAFTIGLSFASVVFFGLTPALHGTRLDLHSSLKGEDRMFGLRLRRSRFRDVLVGGQVAACVVLGIAAAIFVRSFRDTLRTDASLRAERMHVVHFGIDGSAGGAGDLSTARRTLATRVATVRGVTASARAVAVPFEGAWERLHVTGAPGEPLRPLTHNTVTAGYFAVVGQRLQRGRLFNGTDSARDARVAIVSASAARTLWPRSDAIGATMRVARRDGLAGQADTVSTYEVVGVVENARSGSLYADDDDGYVFLLASARQIALGAMPLLVRDDGRTPDVPDALARLAADVDPMLPLDVIAVKSLLAAQTVPFRYAALVTTILGFFGLAIAGVGLYAVVAFAVRQRRREYSIRIAIGATSRDILAAILGTELRIVVAGLVAGAVLALGEAQLLDATAAPLSGIGVGGYLVVMSFLFFVALAATLIPARHAVRIQPIQALREE